jgi:peroxiredoxin
MCQRFKSVNQRDSRLVAVLVTSVVCLAFSGCSKFQSNADQPIKMSMGMPSEGEIVFKDNVESNVEVPQGLDGLVFLDTEGKRVALEGFLGKKNVVLVFTEGFAGGMLCPFCKTQTSRLVANYDKFADLDTEILVVYPGSRDHLEEFVAAAKKSEKAEVDSVPFPLVLDEDLTAVGYFNIQSNLAHPSTFIIDKRGNVRLAYVGADMSADRPSVSAMLQVVDSANTN